IFADGFVSFTEKRPLIFPWKEIAKVSEKITKQYVNGFEVGTDYYCKVQGADGELFVFDHFRYANCQVLGQFIAQGAAREQLPLVLSANSTGGEVDFGTIKVGPKGIYEGNDLLPWEEVGKVWVTNGEIIIGQQNKEGYWCNLDCSKTFNQLVLHEVIN